MIHKIERLISIGKYRNYQAAGDVAFKKLTLFYGDNGGGKTTLTSIFRSLTQNNPDVIRRRKSTNDETTPQLAQIIQRTATGDTHHTFNHRNGWSASYPDIEIFDIHFINENIYSGSDFNDDHKKQLHQFVIGAVGISIQQQMEQNKAQKTASKKSQTDLELQLIQDVGNGLNNGLINSFLTIPQADVNDIDQIISTAEIALTNANANSVIQTLQVLSQLSLINSGIDFNALIADLEATSQTIQDTVLKELFESHCQDLSNQGINGPENWLRTGFSYIENKKAGITDGSSSLTCPFCKQTVDDSINIINAYTLKFNQAFNSLVQRIQKHLTSIQNFNLESTIQALSNANQLNSGRVDSWSIHLPATIQSPVYNIIANENSLRTEYQALISLVQLKLQNPSIAASTNPVLSFQSSLQTINSSIESYNQTVATYNNGANTFRGQIQTIAQAQSEVERVKRIKRRFDPAIDQLCTQLINERQNLRNLEITYTELSLQQQAATTTFFTNYKDRINHYLSNVFKTLFRIEDVVHIPPQGRGTQSKLGYKLTIDGQDISFNNNQNNSTKDCLSEGDKSTIALAFFLSKLDIDPGIANKTLVFDDPLSSFDSNRRMYTVQLLKDLFPIVKQIVVLSHNEFFLYEISKGFSGSDKKILRITENFLTRASTIEPLALETMVENDYFKHIKELEKFLQNPDLNKKDIVLGWLRNVLEAHLRFKFYRQLSGLSSNNQTFGNVITTLVNQNVVFRDNVNRTAIISKLNLINGISCRPHHGEAAPDYARLGANPNTMNVTELANFVRDTLDLVDNKL